MGSDACNAELISKRDAVIQEVGYPKIQELGALFSVISRGSRPYTYPLEKIGEIKERGQAVFDAYNEVAKDERVAYLCLLVYFQMFKELFPRHNARGLEMSWNFVGGKDPDTVWCG
jgi:hypothetical protein